MALILFVWEQPYRDWNFSGLLRQDPPMEFHYLDEEEAIARQDMANMIEHGSFVLQAPKGELPPIQKFECRRVET